jgi:hypothetical protein
LSTSLRETSMMYRRWLGALGSWLALLWLGCSVDATGLGSSRALKQGEMRIQAVPFVQSSDAERIANHLGLMGWAFDVEIAELPSAPEGKKWLIYGEPQVWVKGAQVPRRGGSFGFGDVCSSPMRRRLSISVLEVPSSGGDLQLQVTSSWEPPVREDGLDSRGGVVTGAESGRRRVVEAVPLEACSAYSRQGIQGEVVANALTPTGFCGVLCGGSEMAMLRGSLEAARDAKAAVIFVVWVAAE